MSPDGGGSHRRTCLRWTISLLSGKIQGIFADSAPETVRGFAFRTINQTVTAKFPNQENGPELRHRSFSSSERLVGILSPIVEPPTALLIGSIADYFHRRSVRP